MRILELDEKKGILEIQIEDFMDIFILWNFIKPGDIIEANTYRKIKFESGEADRIKMRLKIRVEKVSFQEMAEILRVSGTIVEGPNKFVSLGAYHTITIKKGMKIKIYRKVGFDDVDLNILREAEVLSKINPVVIVALERDEATIAIIFGTRVKVLTSIYQTESYKDSSNAKALKHMFFRKVFDAINQIVEQYDIAGIVIVGPGLTKVEFKEYLEKNIISKKKIPIILDQASSGTLAGIYEALRRGTILKIVRDHKIAVSMRDYEEFLMHLGKRDGIAFFGLDDVEKIVSWGIAKKVYVVSDLLINNETHKKVISILQEAHKNGIAVDIVSPGHPLYDNIKGFGGIIALAKFPLRIGDFRVENHK